MANELVDYFGEQIMGLRDGIIEEWQRTLDGRMRGPSAERAREQLKIFSADQIAMIRNEVLPDVVDTAIHNFLSFLEGMDEVRISDENRGLAGDVLLNPDGLVFPLFGPDGWIARFSKKPSHFGPSD